MANFYSFVIPVFNRPDEVDALLESISKLYIKDLFFEVLIIEDGSTLQANHICSKWQAKIPVSYYMKSNTGPGDSRNFGMHKAKGNYFIILDSDVSLPPHYLKTVDDFLQAHPKIDFWGGADRSKKDFSAIQKAIDFSMTSFLTTGGIRGSKNKITSFEPRSFNMGISKQAFEASGGFGKIHPGEDPDLSLRLKDLGFKSAFIAKAYVFHKRRINLKKFQQQIRKFGLVRPILMKWHPRSKKATFFLPSLFVISLLTSLVLFILQLKLLLYSFVIYFMLLMLHSLLIHKSFKISLLAVVTSFIQLYVYGTAFLESYYFIHTLQKDETKQYPDLFFD